MAESEKSSSFGSNKSTFKCCKKDVMCYVCVNCSSIYHKSCFLRSKKSHKVSHVSDYKIKCCGRTPSVAEENQVIKLKNALDDLLDKLQQKDNFTTKLKKEYTLFQNEAFENEKESTLLLKRKEKEIEELKSLVAELKKNFAKTSTSVEIQTDIRAVNEQVRDKARMCSEVSKKGKRLVNLKDKSLQNITETKYLRHSQKEEWEPNEENIKEVGSKNVRMKEEFELLQFINFEKEMVNLILENKKVLHKLQGAEQELSQITKNVKINTEND